jgi:CubicO group peptidase (beta-lactamase class C family)
MIKGLAMGLKDNIRVIIKYLPFTLFTLTCVAHTSQTIPTINIHKIKPTELLTGPYSYFVPPYSFYYFQHMDKLDLQFDWIRHEGTVYPLHEPQRPFTIHYTYKKNTYTLDQYFKRNAVTGFLILKDDQIIYEHYSHGANQHSRFLSNSIGKSITSTLFGIALDEGSIKNINDPILKYLPDLNHSGFNRVTLRQALAMTTGVALSYNPYDPESSTHQFNSANLIGKPSFMDLLKSVKADPNVKPGDVFDYENENPQALGFVIEKAVGMPFNKYLQQKLWRKIGAQSDAFLYRAKRQPDQCAFGCLSATLRDYGRFGLMMMNHGRLGETQVVSAAWVKEATTPVKYTAHMKDNKSLEDSESLGYGYLWWIPAGFKQVFQGMGIFGQILYVNSSKHIVIVQAAAWPVPEDNERWDESAKVMDAIVAEISK